MYICLLAGRRCRRGQPGDWTRTDYKAVLLGNPLMKGAGTTIQSVTLASRFGGERNEVFSTVSSLPKENSKTTFEFISPNICPFFDKQLKFLPLGPTLCSLALLETEKQLQDLVTDLVCGSIAGKSLSWDFYAQLMTSQLLATAAVRMTTATNTH